MTSRTSVTPTDDGRSPSGRAAAADAVEPVPVSSKASIPSAAGCTCFEVEGEDPQCVKHGLSIRRIAEWSDVDCQLQPEWESWTIRTVARVTLRRLRAAARLLETGRENGNFDDFTSAAEDLIQDAIGLVCRETEPASAIEAASAGETPKSGSARQGESAAREAGDAHD